MKQRLKRKQLSAIMGILVIIALVAGIVLLSAVVYIAADAMRALGINAWFMQYAQYMLLIVLGIVIVRRFMTEYEYAVVDDELIIDRYIGRRPRNLLRIRLSHILSLSNSASGTRASRMTFKQKRSGVVYMTYREAGTTKCAYLSPNTDLLALIEQRRGAKQSAQ